MLRQIYQQLPESGHISSGEVRSRALVEVNRAWAVDRLLTDRRHGSCVVNSAGEFS